MPDLTDRDAAFKERELDLRAQELELKRRELRRARWFNPLVLAVAAAALGAFANIWLEAEKAESARVLAMIQTGDTEKAATNLDFLLKTGLYSDRKGQVRQYLNAREPGQGPSLPAGAQAAATPPDVVLFDSWNTGGTLNGPSKPAVFRIDRPHQITSIANYHWNDTKGAPAGRMRLKRLEDGSFHATCSAATSPGQDNRANVNWFCGPDVRIPAGTYEVDDSDPATWSYNSQSQGRGFTRVRGYPVN